MRVTFTDGRVLIVPLHWFPILRNATPADIDEDLSIAGLMAGVDRNSG
jgi:hypothetical protein